MRVSPAAGFSARDAAATSRRSPFKRLYVQVLIAIVLGILLGHFYPSLGVEMKPLSDGFITLIRAVVPPIVFATVAVGIAKMGDMRRVGAVGVRALIYFELVSTLALIASASLSAMCCSPAPGCISTPPRSTTRRSPVMSPAPNR